MSPSRLQQNNNEAKQKAKERQMQNDQSENHSFTPMEPISHHHNNNTCNTTNAFNLMINLVHHPRHSTLTPQKRRRPQTPPSTMAIMCTQFNNNPLPSLLIAVLLLLSCCRNDDITILPVTHGFSIITSSRTIHQNRNNNRGRRRHLSTAATLSTLSRRTPITVFTPSSSLMYADDSSAVDTNTNAAAVEEAIVDVQIERPTMNSRRIIGTTTLDGTTTTVEDVWSILTDYNRLAIHVPNLKESRIVNDNKANNNNNNNHRNRSRASVPGDGTYQCQLYQVGAQKIIGFDFSASVTMDMTEQILHTTNNIQKIHFTCVDSPFFRVFDGAWTVEEVINPRTGINDVLCSYDVLVKPKGPVPVAALEWRIREDVPSNLRAVKQAATLLSSSDRRTATTSFSSSSSTGVTDVSSSSKIMTPAPDELAPLTSSTTMSSLALPTTTTRRRNKNTNNANMNAVVTTAARLATRSVKKRIAQQAAMSQQQAAMSLDIMTDYWERGETMAKYL